MEGLKATRWKRFLRFLSKKYRLVILNDATFGEKVSVRLTPYGLIIGMLAITIVMTSFVISIVAFTSLREYIPGYGDIAERKQILELNIKADSLEQALGSHDVYLNAVLKAVDEKIETKTQKPKKDTTGKFAKVNTKPSSTDIQFREEYEQNKSNTSTGIAKLKYTGLTEAVFFTPVKGLITESFDINEEHFGVDIVTKQHETIKTTLDGTIIFTGFSAGDGNVVQVQHPNNLISIYKHCSSFLKTTGDRVKSGEAIAIVGNSGEKSHGPHLHFELWFNGSPINPQDFVAF
ncbi:M23 family metallopeptidase [Aurantibacillus circumpalustris]|uniref:M23 family metallopeptidase n=1 Tax=Aurantibacillus circumpalustris TaxID=3036359 RepID=UPI00295ACD51|nr:M23 family metallopeptidase [Aurantibacillus circumpalustris]